MTRIGRVVTSAALAALALGSLLTSCADPDQWTFSVTSDCNADTNAGEAFVNLVVNVEVELDRSIDFLTTTTDGRSGSSQAFDIHDMVRSLDLHVEDEVHGSPRVAFEALETDGSYRALYGMSTGGAGMLDTRLEWKVYANYPGSDDTEQLIDSACTQTRQLFAEIPSGNDTMVLSAFDTDTIRIVNGGDSVVTLTNIELTDDPDENFAVNGVEVFSLSPAATSVEVPAHGFVDFEIMTAVPQGSGSALFRADTSDPMTPEIKIPLLSTPL